MAYIRKYWTPHGSSPELRKQIMPIWGRNSSVRTPILLLALAEFLLLYLAVPATDRFLSLAFPRLAQELGWLSVQASVLSATTIFGLASMGLYDFHQRLYFKEILARVIVGIAIGTIGVAAIYFVFPDIALPVEFAMVSLTASFAGILLARRYFFHHVDSNIFRRRTLIFGAGDKAATIEELRRRADRRGFTVVGVVRADGDAHRSQVIGPSIDARPLDQLVRELQVDEIVIAMDDRRGNLPTRELLRCIRDEVDVVELVEFLERESGKIRTDLINPSWLIFSPGFRASLFRRIGKRTLDVCISVMALLCFWPLMLAIAVAILIEDGFGATVLYRQKRVGLKGEVFSMLKFRSMVEDAEKICGAVWAEQDDARITRVGHVIRKFRLDEIPQFWNVLRGEMSLVGPRPERPEFVEQLVASVPYFFERHLAKPGVTGWAQLRYGYGSSREDAAEKLQYDFYYIKNQSLILDLVILLQTIEVVIWGKGSR
jgi:sugar transferase (PEP-CTERM system associated)